METLRPQHLSLDGPPLRLAYHLAKLAHAAYSDHPAEEVHDVARAFPVIETFRNSRIFGVVAGNGDSVVVAFRGTHEDREWLEALAYGHTDWVVGKAHKGFVRLLDSVWKQVLAGLYDTGADSRRIWVTGHSIGGGLAVLAAQRLESEGFDVAATVTFGAPAVLNPVAARAIRCPVMRVVNNEDTVPDMPWPTLFDTYEHVGQRYLLTASGALAAYRYTPQLARRIDRAMSIGDGPQEAGLFHDHSITSYLNKLRRYAN